MRRSVFNARGVIISIGCVLVSHFHHFDMHEVAFVLRCALCKLPPNGHREWLSISYRTGFSIPDKRLTHGQANGWTVMHFSYLERLCFLHLPEIWYVWGFSRLFTNCIIWYCLMLHHCCCYSVWLHLNSTRMKNCRNFFRVCRAHLKFAFFSLASISFQSNCQKKKSHYFRYLVWWTREFVVSLVVCNCPSVC